MEENLDIEYTEMIKKVLEEIEKSNKSYKKYMRSNFKDLLKNYGKDIRDKKSLAQRILKIIEEKEKNPEYLHMIFNEFGDFGSEKFKNLTAGYNEYYNIYDGYKYLISSNFVIMLNVVYGEEFMLKSLYGGNLEENVEKLGKHRKNTGTLKLFEDIDIFLGEYLTDEAKKSYVPTEKSKEQIRNIFERLKKDYRKKSPSWSENILCKVCYDSLMGTNTSNLLSPNDKIRAIYINPREYGFIKIAYKPMITVKKGRIDHIFKSKRVDSQGGDAR